MSELKVHESEKKRGRPSAPKLVDQDRFRKLVDNESERGISRQKIADSIGCDVSTITKHYNGDSPIDLKYLYEYSKYFKVSTDYLLGLSEVSSPDPKDIAICEEIGCSEDALNALQIIFCKKKADNIRYKPEEYEASHWREKYVFELLLRIISKVNDPISSPFFPFLSDFSDAVIMSALADNLKNQNEDDFRFLNYIADQAMKSEFFEWGFVKSIPDYIKECSKQIKFNIETWEFIDSKTGKTMNHALTMPDLFAYTELLDTYRDVENKPEWMKYMTKTGVYNEEE